MPKERIMIGVLVLLLAFMVGRTSAPVGAAVPHGGIPDKKGLIHGCYAKAGGAMRIIDPSLDKCKPTEGKVTWQQKQAVPNTPIPATVTPTSEPDTPEPATPMPLRVEHTYTVTSTFKCDKGPYCIIDEIPLAHQPISLDYTYKYPGKTLVSSASAGLAEDQGICIPSGPPGSPFPPCPRGNVRLDWDGSHLTLFASPPMTLNVGTEFNYEAMYEIAGGRSGP